MSKYNNSKTVLDGIEFDSKAEGEYYTLLKKERENGLIHSFELQPRFILQDKFVKDGVSFRKIEYVADFLITHNDGSVEVVDIKGMETPEFRIKRKLFEKKYPHRLKLLKYVKKFGGWIEVDEWKKKKREEKKVSKCHLKNSTKLH